MDFPPKDKKQEEEEERADEPAELINEIAESVQGDLIAIALLDAFTKFASRGFVSDLFNVQRFAELLTKQTKRNTRRANDNSDGTMNSSTHRPPCSSLTVNDKNVAPRAFDKVSEIAICVYYRYRKGFSDSVCVSRDGAADDENNRNERFAKNVRTEISSAMTIISEYGVKREFKSARELAECLLEFVTHKMAEEAYVDAKVCESGSIRFCSRKYYERAKEDGWWRCSICGNFVTDERSLWWHQKTAHKFSHVDAIKEVEHERLALSVILNDVGGYNNKSQQSKIETKKNKKKDPMDLKRCVECAKNGDLGEEFEKCIIEKKIARLPSSLEYSRRGDLEALKALRQEEPSEILQRRDANGASALHWACGSAHLHVVKYLVEECGFDPNNHPQTGKRSYEGRTPLHWAARNGNMLVSEYLLEKCNVDVNCKTNDGTSAFAWATWQGEIEVMRMLIKFGANPRECANQYGCNASMWACQGDGDNVAVCEYLMGLSVSFRLVNANGHSVLHKAAQRGNVKVVDWLIKNSRRLGISNLHVAKDSEGFRPSDLAKMEDKIILSGTLERFQERIQLENSMLNSRSFEEKEDDNDDNILVMRHRVLYPPSTFYCSISIGRLDIFRSILEADPYYAGQDNGSGAPLHFASSYGQQHMIPELLERGANINQRDIFGMTPLHRAAILVQKYIVGLDLLQECENLKMKLAESIEKKINIEKIAWKRHSQRIKEIETMLDKPSHLLGTKFAIQTYRSLLARGADSNAKDAILKCTPRELAKRSLHDNFAKEIEDENTRLQIEILIQEMENDTKEAPIESIDINNDRSSSRIDDFRNWRALKKRFAKKIENMDDTPYWCTYYAERDRTLEDKCKENACKEEININKQQKQTDDVDELQAIDALEEDFKEDHQEIIKEMIGGVPGAFRLRNCFSKASSRVLAKYCDQIQPNKYNQTNARRESMAEKIMRTNIELLKRNEDLQKKENLESILEGFRILAVDPIITLSTTDTFYGESRLPVEPVSWTPDENNNKKNEAVLEKLAKRIRRFFPERSGADALSGRYLVSDDKSMLDKRLRCYRYSEKTCSIPHYDKSTVYKQENNTSSSAYSLIIYLNGDEHIGGETGFFVDDNESNSRKSNSGLTKSCGDGNFPLARYITSVKGNTGDILCFPHGAIEGDFAHLLHDGREVLPSSTGQSSKFLIRTDVMYTS